MAESRHFPRFPLAGSRHFAEHFAQNLVTPAPLVNSCPTSHTKLSGARQIGGGWTVWTPPKCLDPAKFESYLIALQMADRPIRAYIRSMTVLIVVILAAWLILSIVGFALEGLLWLGVIGVVLFVATVIIGLLRRSARRRAHHG